MRMEGGEDILATAQRRRATRKTSTRPPFPADHMLRIDNFTLGNNSTSNSPVVTPRKVAPKGFVAEIEKTEKKRASKNPSSFIIEEIPYSRNILPPLISVEIHGTDTAALVHTACHVSFLSDNFVTRLGIRHDILHETTLPPSPISSTGSSSPWLVNGKLRYVELTIGTVKHVSQFFIGQDMPTDVVIGADLLKKAQMKVNFQDSTVTMPAKDGEHKIPFLTNKEINAYRPTNSMPNTSTRAYSSNF